VKKTAVFLMTLFLGLMLSYSVVEAGPGCGLSKKSSAACSKSCAKVCSVHITNKGEEAKTESGMICDKKCDYAGKCMTLHMNVEGMVCGGCESTITKALTDIKGVVKVHSVDHETGLAVVCFDPDKVESTRLTKVVTNTGYKAKVIPAAAVVVDADDKKVEKTCATGTKVVETKKKDY
jgi:copper chaperone CopZ